MTTQPVENLLQWTLADRMTKALRVSGLKASDMAEYLGMSRNSVGNWINGRIAPDTRTLRLFALRTGVPYEWLTTGEISGKSGPDGPNARPSDYMGEVFPMNEYRSFRRVTPVPFLVA